MARTKRSDKPFYFDAKGMHDDLRKALYQPTVMLQKELQEKVKQAIDGLPYKDNLVKLADGSVTSDRARMGSLLNSMATQRVKAVAGSLANDLTHLPMGWGGDDRSAWDGSVSVMGDKGNYRESHIGVYYEYGTGELEDVSKLQKFSIYSGDPNTDFRTPKSGDPVVSRPSSEWRDMGGNLRKSYGGGGVGRDNQMFNDYIGPDIAPLHWFEDVYLSMKPRIIEVFRGAIKEFYTERNLQKYLKYPQKIYLWKE